MRIGLLAPPVERVPPENYGGTERVVGWLADALVARGHDVTLFASGDSRTRARLVPTVERAVWHDRRYQTDAPFWALATVKAYGAAERLDLDLMHNHMDFHAYPSARASLLPTVTTLHGRLDLPELAPLYREFREQALVSISDAQRAALPDARWLGTVRHGLPLDLYRPSTAPGSYLAFCGRISPEKGLDRAIRVAIRAGLPLKIAARPPFDGLEPRERARDEAYFEARVKPFLDHPLIEYLGLLADREKQELYAGAAATLFPIDWPEPFGIVLIESLACGTPVLATPCGSVPELIAPRRTGFHCRTDEEYVAAIDAIGTIDRAGCRAEFERRFSAPVMASAYERIYAALVASAVPADESVVAAGV